MPQGCNYLVSGCQALAALGAGRPGRGGAAARGVGAAVAAGARGVAAAREAHWSGHWVGGRGRAGRRQRGAPHAVCGGREGVRAVGSVVRPMPFAAGEQLTTKHVGADGPAAARGYAAAKVHARLPTRRQPAGPRAAPTCAVGGGRGPCAQRAAARRARGAGQGRLERRAAERPGGGGARGAPLPALAGAAGGWPRLGGHGGGYRLGEGGEEGVA